MLSRDKRKKKKEVTKKCRTKMTTALHIPQGGFVFRIVKVAVDTFTVFSFGPLNQLQSLGLKSPFLIL